MTTYTTNKNYSRLYEEIKRYTAGIQLLGIEVKAIKTGKANLRGGYISIENNEAFLKQVHIAPYQPNNTPSTYDPERTRRLLLTKKEIEEILQNTSQKGLTVIPIKMYYKNNIIKVDIAVVRGKKKYDHREKIKRRDTQKETGYYV